MGFGHVAGFDHAPRMGTTETESASRDVVWHWHPAAVPQHDPGLVTRYARLQGGSVDGRIEARMAMMRWCRPCRRR